jgi:hypothetical protein
MANIGTFIAQKAVQHAFCKIFRGASFRLGF